MANTTDVQAATNTDVLADVELWKYQGDINSVATFEELAANAETLVFNPYEVINKDKDALIGVPFVIRHGRIATDQNTFQDYAVLYVVTKDNDMYVVTDGSTGIMAQYVAKVNEYGKPGPFLIPNGLRKSEYLYEDPISGVKSPAVTYYFA